MVIPHHYWYVITSTNSKERKRITARWDLKFRRRLRAWEELEAVRLMDKLNSNTPCLTEKADALVWKASSNGLFNTAAVYNKLTSGQVLPATELIWKNVSPPKVKFFCWLVWKGRIKSRAYLQSLGLMDQNTRSDCVFCNEELESLNHVMLLCPVVWQVWSNLLKWWGMQWVSPQSVVGLLDWWRGIKWRKVEGIIWKVIPLATLWSVWKMRNECVFNGKQPLMVELLELIKTRVILWFKAESRDSFYSVQELVLNLQHVRQILC
ncbi:uncharacterized protein LOC114273801 [Camellia sinensis]|uniref:uncharacterized protein LOC114273801 n=1 Tax=Camellia sinensis TaxID=4442 RepID=UPI001035FAAD|nr:uncharacterized protein LOC114273801 [Camellia sinensis]